jgi:hypothetical protein
VWPASSPTGRLTLPLGCHSSTLRSTPALQAGKEADGRSSRAQRIREHMWCCLLQDASAARAQRCPGTPPTWPPVRRPGCSQRCVRPCGAGQQWRTACLAPGPELPGWHPGSCSPGPHLQYHTVPSTQGPQQRQARQVEAAVRGTCKGGTQRHAAPITCTAW